jgi:hypothetical protein
MGWEEIVGMVVGTVLSFIMSMSFFDKLASHIKSIVIAVVAFAVGIAFYLGVPELRQNFEFLTVLWWALAALGTGAFGYSTIIRPIKGKKKK